MFTKNTSKIFCLITHTNIFFCFSQQIRPQITIQLCILQDYSSVRIGFDMINKMPHTAYSIDHVVLNPINFNHYCFTQSLMKYVVIMFKF